jgi:ribonuclease HI
VTLTAFTDGASRGNPGESGLGIVVKKEDGTVLVSRSRYLGRTTNNVAEYQGALLALRRAQELGARRVELRVDSELVANQIKGGYRVKSPNLVSLFSDLKRLAGRFDEFEVTRVARGENRQADKLANLAIASGRA